MNGISITEFYDEGDDAEVFKFAEVGDTVAGTVIRPPLWQDDKYNPGTKALCLTLDTDDGARRVFLRKAQLRALGKAVSDAGSTTVAEGDWVKVIFADEREGRGAHPMRIWVCEFKAAPPMGAGELGEVDPYGDAEGVA